MAFEAVVLGANGTYPTPGGACSGYLLRSGGTEVWVDLGTGTFANLQRHTEYHGLRAVVISHLHADHVVDLFPFYYALRYGRDCRGPQGIRVLAPAGAEEHLARFLSTAGPADFGGYFDFRPLESGARIRLGPFHLRFARTRHPIETYAVRAEVDGRVVAYTSDTAYSEAVVDLARGADVLIAEATLHEPMSGADAVHMTAEDAGATAAAAGAGRLVLVHITPGLDPQESVGRAARRFSGAILVASENLRLEV